MLLAPVTTMPMPSMRPFCMLLPCIPRVAGRRISEPCISWNSTSGRYFDASLKFFTCPFTINSLGNTFMEYGVSRSGAGPSGPIPATVSTRYPSRAWPSTDTKSLVPASVSEMSRVAARPIVITIPAMVAVWNPVALTTTAYVPGGTV